VALMDAAVWRSPILAGSRSAATSPRTRS